MTSHPADRRRLAVLVATFRRPGELRALLGDLAGVVAQAPPTWDIDVVVCDNDPEASARATCADDPPVPVRYVHEPRPGIANARNALLEAAVADHELVAFVDDDERVGPGWLGALVGVADRFDADVVSGPVVSEFEADPPDWLAASRWFQRSRHPTGTPIEWVGTGNVLIRTSALEGPPRLRFDEAYGLTGGSDTLLFLRLGARGARMVWADDAAAEAREVVPASRTSVRWVLRRAFRIGNSHPGFDRTLGRGRRQLAMRAVKGAGWIGVGLGRGVAALVARDRRRGLEAADRVAWGSGMVAGAVGYRFVEYRRKGSS